MEELTFQREFTFETRAKLPRIKKNSQGLQKILYNLFKPFVFPELSRSLMELGIDDFPHF